MKQEKRWLMAETDPVMAGRLARRLGLPPVIAGMLIRRGLTDEEAAKRFLNPDRSGFYDPFLMKDMEKTVDRIRRAIAGGERIMVYGDYDADGATSTALMYLALKKLGAQVEFYIPDRFEEGYGLNGPALAQAKERGFHLVVTVDNGISAVEEARLASELGLDLIVTDHHTPPEALPEAYAILNPKQPGCAYPDKMLAGVGVVFKVAQALFGELPEEFLDLAALGTVADLAPLVDENRLFAIYGLERINRSPRPGIEALIEVSGLSGKEINAGHIGFALGPRINAAGRLDSAAYAVELLVTEDGKRARELAGLLDRRNRERQAISDEMSEEAAREVEAHPEWLENRVLVVAKEGWNTGVIGIAASRLVERYYRPVLMISVNEGVGKGSARSIHGFHLYDAMNACRELFGHFGGHKMAAGFSIEASRIDELRDRLQRIAQEVLTPEDLIPKIEIDAELDLAEIGPDFVETIGRLAPFGFGNPGPRFQFSGLTIERCRPVGQDGAHLQLRVAKGAARIGGIAFRRGAEADLVNRWTRLDLVGELTVNEWNGQKNLQIILEDWRPNAIQVFDCRHVADKIHWLEEQAGEKDLTVICFHEESLAEVSRALAPYPWQEPRSHRVYAADEKGELILASAGGGVHFGAAGGGPSGGGAGQTPFRPEDDVVVYDLPLSMEQYEAVLTKIAGPNRLYLLYGTSDRNRFEERKKYLLPDRKFFAGIYKILQETGSCKDSDIRKRLQPAYHEAVDLVLSVFVELGFAVRDGNTYHVNKGTDKRSLEESELYQKRRARVESYTRVIGALIDSSSEQAVTGVLRLLASKSEGVQGL